MKVISRNLGKRMEYTEVEGNGMEGGLATFWNPHYLHLISAEASRSYISLGMKIIGESNTYLCTNIYSSQRLENKLLMLDYISKMQHRHSTAEAIYGGDFNMITSLEEKKGGVRTLNRDAEAFNSFIRAVNLVDMLPKNGLYTWNNKRGGDR